jgi:D-sedoheptulose 7-phosphate isomerase
VSFSESYLEETRRIVGELDPDSIERLATGLAKVRDGGGRLFVLGVGGSAAHAGHAVNDFRKLCGFETYAPTDNVSELTARVNDDGWDSAYVEWLRGSRLGSGGAILVLSVGGGSVATNLSANLVAAMDHARQVGAKIYAIVGRDGGYAREIADTSVVIPPLVTEHVTPHTEGLASVICHLLVSHPALQQSAPVWESRG